MQKDCSCRCSGGWTGAACDTCALACQNGGAVADGCARCPGPPRPAERARATEREREPCAPRRRRRFAARLRACKGAGARTPLPAHSQALTHARTNANAHAHAIPPSPPPPPSLSLLSGAFGFQVIFRLRELAALRALECREFGAGPEVLLADVDLSSRPCKLRMQVRFCARARETRWDFEKRRE